MTDRYYDPPPDFKKWPLKEIAVRAQIATLNRVLAEATKECPAECSSRTECIHAGCGGTGRVARFPGFRQVCWCQAEGEAKCLGPYPDEDDEECNGTGWQVRAGGLEDGLAGLSKDELAFWHAQFFWAMPITMALKDDPDVPMPSAPEILAGGLRLVIEVAGLE